MFCKNRTHTGAVRGVTPSSPYVHSPSDVRSMEYILCLAVLLLQIKGSVHLIYYLLSIIFVYFFFHFRSWACNSLGKLLRGEVVPDHISFNFSLRPLLKKSMLSKHTINQLDSLQNYAVIKLELI